MLIVMKVRPGTACALAVSHFEGAGRDRAGDRCTVASYFTDHGPERGPWLYRDSRMSGAIGVLSAPDKHLPIGMALSNGPDGAGIDRWKLTVPGAELHGLWVVIDREFRPV